MKTHATARLQSHLDKSRGQRHWKHRKPVAAALKEIYRAKDAETAKENLEAFAAREWGSKYPRYPRHLAAARQPGIPFFVFPQAVRRIIYTTNAIESLNAKLRRAVKTRGHFPNDKATTKLLCSSQRVPSDPPPGI